MKVGIVSDTHGLLRPEILAAFAGVDHILHAGDVGDPAILNLLRELAPVTAIRGNIDLEGECSLLPETDLVELAGRFFYLVHSRHDLDLEPAAAGVDMVVSGHSHQPSIEIRRGVLYVNPGSAGPRRFRLPTTVALAQWSSQTAASRGSAPVPVPPIAVRLIHLLEHSPMEHR